MIGKIFKKGKALTKGKGGFRYRIRYIFGMTKHDHAITSIRTIGKNCFSADPLRHGTSSDKIETEPMIAEFDSVQKMRGASLDTERMILPVWHAMLSLSPGENLTDAEWLQAVEMYVADMGFTDENKWVAVLHQDTDNQHVHIVSNRIRLNEEFSLTSDKYERDRSMDSASRIEDLFGLRKAPRPEETSSVAISHAEMQASEKTGVQPFKLRLIARVFSAMEKTMAADGDMFMFVRLLRKQQVYVQFTKNKQGQPTGISYEYQGKVIAGRNLKRARFTFQKLTQQEGIHYDPETISELEDEAARRDRGAEERVRIYYLVIRARNRRSIRLSFEAKKQQELEATVKLIIAAILALFGIRANWELEDKKEGEPYYQLRSNWVTAPQVEQERDVDFLFHQHHLENTF